MGVVIGRLLCLSTPCIGRTYGLLISVFLYSCLNGCESSDDADLFDASYISNISIDSLQGIPGKITIERISPSISKVLIKYQLSDSVHQDDLKIEIHPAFKPSFHWSPHLTPSPNHIIAQHVFRAPALIVSDTQRQIVLIPDLDLIGKVPGAKWYMDLDATRETLTIGLSDSKVTEHVLFSRKNGMTLPPGEVSIGFYILTNGDSSSLANPWRKPLALMYEKWFYNLYKQGEPVKGPIEPYVRHSYKWAFDTWKQNVWQEFNLNGKSVGAPVFIVNVTQSPNYPGEINEREFRSIWNQAWFSSMRSASGLYRYARRVDDHELMAKASMTKELALGFPQQRGLFPAVIGTDMTSISVKGHQVSRSKGWGKYHFGNSNRNPLKAWGSFREAPYHILDMSWTAYLMLMWHTELEKDERLVAYATRYADRLLKLQEPDGFFPTWLEMKSQAPLPLLKQSPETSMSVTFLLKMYEVSNEAKYLEAAKRAMNAVMKDVIPSSKWEDFETYWSCSTVLDTLVGQKVERNDAYKQNTLSMFWTAEALYNLYQVTKSKEYLTSGQRVLDELLMYQATWQPPFIPIRSLGGFGVMNADGEWNDSRQSLFAELIINYGKAFDMDEYRIRGKTALRSSFVMMYCPENPETKAQWEKVYPFFNEKDYGFMMENYGHGGETNAEGLGIGEFTIYDWGNGAAAEAYNRIVDHFGQDLFN